MRRILVTSAVAALTAVTVVPALAGQPDGQGAQKSGLSPQAGSNMSQCAQGSGTQTNGFAILNTAGKVGAAQLTNGEVSLKGALSDQTYTVYIAQGGTCTVPTTLQTNQVGNGNSHLQTSPGLQGMDFYVVVQQNMKEVYASGPVNLQ